MALVGSGQAVLHLVFGYATAEAAMKGLAPTLLEQARFGPWMPSVTQRLQAYAEGSPEDFTDVDVDPGVLTEFQRRVIRGCRRIRYGQTLTYAQLAAKAGCPGAARAVGNCMARNRIPLIIPCHRVIGSHGGLGGYSAPGGVSLKRRLLQLEGLEL
jgi:methylated-DNA-[protein]-cysteine S-methyltransferase